jgi:ferredoxin
MIIGEQKPLEEIKGLIGDAENVLVMGCGTCVTVCFAGGEREALTLATSLRMSTKLEGDAKEITETTIQRQCEWEYLDQVRSEVESADAIVSLACGVGVQAIAEKFPDSWVVPGLNTSFMGLPVEQGVWEERCAACGELIHDRLVHLDRLDVLMNPQPPKNWKAARDGGPRRIVRDDLRRAADQE